MFGLFKRSNINKPVKEIVKTFREEGRWEEVVPGLLSKDHPLYDRFQSALPAIPQEALTTYYPDYFETRRVWLGEYIHDSTTDVLICVSNRIETWVEEYPIGLTDDEKKYIYEAWEAVKTAERDAQCAVRRAELAKLYEDL